MKTRATTLAVRLLVLFFGLSSVGCLDSKGRKFEKMPMREGYATEYHFRRWAYVGGGVPQRIFRDGNQIGALQNAGWLAFYVLPGRHTYAGSGGPVATIDAQSGKEYFFEWGIRGRLIGQPEREEALKMIASLRESTAVPLSLSSDELALRWEQIGPGMTVDEIYSIAADLFSVDPRQLIDRRRLTTVETSCGNLIFSPDGRLLSKEAKR